MLQHINACQLQPADISTNTHALCCLCQACSVAAVLLPFIADIFHLYDMHQARCQQSQGISAGQRGPWDLVYGIWMNAAVLCPRFRLKRPLQRRIGRSGLAQVKSCACACAHCCPVN